MSTSCPVVTHQEPLLRQSYEMSSATSPAYPVFILVDEAYWGWEECRGLGGAPVYVPRTTSDAALLEVRIDGRSLAMALRVRVGYSDGYYEIEHEEFGVFGCGRTQAEAVKDFLAFLMADFKHYALARDGDLDPGARELAGKYRRLFGIRK